MAIKFMLISEGIVVTGIRDDSFDYVKERAKTFIKNRKRLRIRSVANYDRSLVNDSASSKIWRYDYQVDDWVEC